MAETMMQIKTASAAKILSSVTRLPDIERAKRHAILLVVFGRVIARESGTWVQNELCVRGEKLPIVNVLP